MEGCFSAVRLRKGAWTHEEDILLKKCIFKFGEGKWHLVPFRAGLNRCRKSCRLRWMNYLKPDIKRGKFSVDEVDLILRLHKLLGNRWSLIAGRIPGRTANDVKNYWNTHVRKKSLSHREKIKVTETDIDYDYHREITKTTIVRPRPRIFKANNNDNDKVKSPKLNANDMSSKDRQELAPVLEDTTNYWLETINSLSNSSGFDIINLDTNKNIGVNDHHHIASEESANYCEMLSVNNDNNIKDLFGDRTITAFNIEDDPQFCWTDFVIDMDLWDVTSTGGGETK